MTRQRVTALVLLAFVSFAATPQHRFCTQLVHIEFYLKSRLEPIKPKGMTQAPAQDTIAGP